MSIFKKEPKHGHLCHEMFSAFETKLIELIVLIGELKSTRENVYLSQDQYKPHGVRTLWEIEVSFVIVILSFSFFQPSFSPFSSFLVFRSSRGPRLCFSILLSRPLTLSFTHFRSFPSRRACATEVFFSLSSLSPLSLQVSFPPSLWFLLDWTKRSKLTHSVFLFNLFATLHRT